MKSGKGKFREFTARLLATVWRRSGDRELDEEMTTHLEMLIEENIRRGMALREARRIALIDFGGFVQTTEAYRDQKRLPFMETLIHDIRYGFRMLRKNPGFTTVAVLTLALGIGANSAIFNVLNAVMLNVLPVQNPRQLLLVSWTSAGWPRILEDLEGSNRKEEGSGVWVSESVAYPIFEAIRTRNTTLSSAFAFSANINGFNAQIEGKSYSVSNEAVSGDYFAGLGVQMLLGRPIVAGDDGPGVDSVSVLSHKFWKSRLGGDPSIVGKTIVLNNVPMTIIGVAPQDFFGTQPGEDIDVWTTLTSFPRLVKSLNFSGPGPQNEDLETAAINYFQKPTTWWLVVMGRLKPQVSELEARADLDMIFTQSIDSMITSDKQQENRPALRLGPGSQGLDSLRRQFSEPLLVLMIAVGLVLLIACANVAGLLLARATARQKEIAVRLSLGARRIRLIQQLLTESILLSLIGGGLGLLLSRWISAVLLNLVASGRQTIILSLDMNLRVLGFTAGVAILTGVVFGLAPAFSATKISLTAVLKDGGSGRPNSRRSRFAKALVSAQIALSLILLVAAGLFLRTLEKLEKVPIGFDRGGILLFSVTPGLNGYRDQRLADYYQQVKDHVSSIPGVSAVTFSAHAAVGDGSSSSAARIPGVTQGKEQFDLYRHLVGPDYFETLGIPVLAGRVLDPKDNTTAPKVAVVNQALSRGAFGDRNPLGQILRFGGDKTDRDYEIVGVVGDVKYSDLRKPAPPTAYFSHLQSLVSAGFMTFQVRTAGDPASFLPAIRERLAQIDENVPLSRIDTLVDRIDKALMFERLFSRLTSAFGLLALLLVCVGLYGTMSYFVARRTSEIGIRMALGARPAGVFRMILLEGLLLIVAGVVVGLAGAAFGTKLISSSLYNVAPIDPLTFSLVALILIAVGLLACYIPARRAMKVDPMVALRYE